MPVLVSARTALSRHDRDESGAVNLLAVGGSCQRTWEHSVAKAPKPAGPRIPIQVRPPGVY